MIVPILKSTEVMLSAVADAIILVECYLAKIEGTQIIRLKSATWRPTLQEVQDTDFMSETHHPHQAFKLYLQSVNTITHWMNNYPKTSAHIFIYTRLLIIQRLQRKTQHLSGVRVSLCWWVLFSPFDMVSQQKVWRYSGQCLLMNTHYKCWM